MHFGVNFAIPRIVCSLIHLAMYSYLHICLKVYHIPVPFSLSLHCHISTRSACSTSSTSPKPHCTQILSSLFNPTYLPESTLSCAVPPLSSVRIHLRPFSLLHTPQLTYAYMKKLRCLQWLYEHYHWNGAAVYQGEE